MPRTPILTSYRPPRRRRPRRAAMVVLLGVIGAAAVAVLVIAFGETPAAHRAPRARVPVAPPVAAPPQLVARGVGSLGAPVEAAAAASVDPHQTVLLGGL